MTFQSAEAARWLATLISLGHSESQCVSNIITIHRYHRHYAHQNVVLSSLPQRSFLLVPLQPGTAAEASPDAFMAKPYSKWTSEDFERARRMNQSRPAAKVS